MKIAMDKKKTLIFSILTLLWSIFIIWAITKTIHNKNASFMKKPFKQIKKILVHHQRTVMVHAFKVKRVNYRNTLPVMGTIKGKSKIPLKFEISGTIKKIYFKEGEFVQKGKIVACLDDKDARLKLQYATDKLNAAKSNYESLRERLKTYEGLYKIGALVKTKIDEMKLTVDSARSEYKAIQSQKELAEKELEKTCIVAPENSVMGERKSEEGEFVTPHDQLGSLLDVSEIFVEAGIVERDIPKLRIGQKAKVYVDAYPGKTFHGNLVQISPLVQGKSRTLTVRIKVSDAGRKLLPGMFSRVEIIIADLHNAYIVPTNSLVKSGKNQYLLPVIPMETIESLKDGEMAGTLHLESVKVGFMDNDYAEILSGVSSGDMVVTESQGELDNNIKVRIIGTEEYNF